MTRHHKIDQLQRAYEDADLHASTLTSVIRELEQLVNKVQFMYEAACERVVATYTELQQEVKKSRDGE